MKYFIIIIIINKYSICLNPKCTFTNIHIYNLFKYSLVSYTHTIIYNILYTFQSSTYVP